MFNCLLMTFESPETLAQWVWILTRECQLPFWPIGEFVCLHKGGLARVISDFHLNGRRTQTWGSKLEKFLLIGAAAE